jgi:hypothetical protein
LNFLRIFSKNTQILNFVKFRTLGGELFHADRGTGEPTDGQTDGRKDGRTDGLKDERTDGWTYRDDEANCRLTEFCERP